MATPAKPDTKKDTKPNANKAVDDSVESPGAKLMKDLTNKFQAMLGESTGVTAARDSSSAVARGLREQENVPAVTVPVIPEAELNPELWKASLDQARTIYPENDADTVATRVDAARRFFKSRLAE